MTQKSTWQHLILSYSNVLCNLQQQLNTHLNRFSPFRTLFLDLFKVTDKFVSSLLTISDSISQQILGLLIQSEQPLSGNYNNLRMSLMGIVQTWKQVSVRSRNQLMDPLKIFSDNYKKLCVESVTRLKKQLGVCVNAEGEMVRSRQSYYICCEKLERHKESQAKLMLKIENGETGALQKFNKTTRALLQRVSSSQRAYSESVERANEATVLLKNTTEKQLGSLRQNEISRVQFLKKSADNQVRILQNSKVGDSLSKLNTHPTQQLKGLTFLKDSLVKMQKWASNLTFQVFVSHEQVMKSKRQKQFQCQNPLLAELFQKVKESEKPSIKQFAAALLQLPHGIKLVSVQKPPREGRLVFPPQWQNFRQKIFSLHHYCFYFCHLLASEIVQLPHYYIKLSTPYFRHLHTFLRNIIKFLDSKGDTKLSDPAIATIYQLLRIAERVVERKEGKVKVGGIKALIEDLGTCPELRNVRTIEKIGKHLLKKVQAKKSERGGMIGFTKGLFSTLTGKKQEQQCAEEAEFNILVELTQIMSKLSLPTELALPYLKNAVKQNQASYQYLKDMLLSKRDREQRQKILLNQNTRFKSLKHLIEDSSHLKNTAVLRLVSQCGFLSLKDLSLRSVCRRLKDINLNIIYRTNLPVSSKWKMMANPLLSAKFLQMEGDPTLLGQHTEVEDIIALDVQRSFQMHYDRLPPTSLKSFLVFYARQNPQMPYCQGMNYIAGLLLLKSKTAGDAYCIFKWSMDKLFLPVFKDNFAGMRPKLYILDRLLSIFHPDIYDHLKKEMITPECYAVGWIITAFSSAYQYTASSFLVDWFWERFLLWGWTEFYRLTLWLFQLNRDYIIGASYDKCLQVFGEINRCPALIAETREIFLQTCPGDLQGAFESFAVSQDLIDQIVKQHEHQ